MATDSAIACDIADGTAIISIVRADKANSLRARDKRALAEQIDALGTRSEVRSVVIVGDGPRAFCAGSDINEMRQFGVEEMHAMLADERAMYVAVLRCEKPVVAAINGFAMGAGLILAMVTDYSVAATSAQLGTPELTIGVAAPLEGLLLPYLVGVARAREMFYLGRRIHAEEAVAIGLVNAVSPDDQVLAKATEVAARIAALPSSGFRVQKQLLNRLLASGNLEQTIVESHYATSLQFADEDTGRAMAAFLGVKDPAARTGEGRGATPARHR